MNSAFEFFRCHSALSLLFFLSAATSNTFATAFYIDFDNGSDSNNGTSAATAFKHCPGDPAAEGKVKTTKLDPGDTAFFKGGVVYRGTIIAVSSGAEGKPILYDGNTAGTYGKGNAVIDGSELVTGLTPCASAADCGGNPNWKNIVTAWLPEKTEPGTANLFQDDTMFGLAQDPNLKDPFFPDDRSTFRKVPFSQCTDTTITDPLYFTQKDAHAFDGAILMIWANPNRVFPRKIQSYDPAAHKITFEKVPAGLYKDRDTEYGIVNTVMALDRPGEYVVSMEKNSDGKRKVYVWPFGDVKQAKITVSVRDHGFDVAGKSFLTFQGFIVQKQSGDKIPAGFHNAYNATDKASHIIIRNNTVRWVRCAERWNAVSLSSVNHLLIDSNEVYENPQCRGILVTDADDATISNNLSRKNGGTGIAFFGAHHSKMLGNTVIDNTGVHANGMTVYLESSDVLVAYNKVSNSNIAFTSQSSKNITVAYNTFVGTDLYVFADWDGTDGLKILNNVILKDVPGDTLCALTVGKNSKGIVLKNNIITGSGAERAAVKPEQSNNIYTRLSPTQKETALEPGAKLVKDMARIFVDPAHGDYRLKPGSPAIGSGISVGQERDFAGTPLPKDKAPDIGAYQFTGK